MSKSKKSDTNDLFEHHEHALEKAYEICPECGSELHLKKGKAGTFLGCENYPTCQYTRALHENNPVDDKIIEGSECPECGHLLAVKHGRYGLFIGCTNYPECRHIEEETKADANVPCPKCKTGELQERTSRFGKKFYSCNNYPKCKYIVNFEPVNQPCPECHWPILVKRSMAKGDILQCPEKKCTFKTNPV